MNAGLKTGNTSIPQTDNGNRSNGLNKEAGIEKITNWLENKKPG